MKSTPNVLLIWDRAGHYHLARWKALGERLGKDNAHLANLGGADSLYQWESGSGECFHQLSSKPVESFDLFGRIRAFRFLLKKHTFTHIAIPGYGRLEYLFFLLISRLMHKKVILFAESWYRGNPILEGIKSWFLKWSVDGFFVSGERAKTHFSKNLKVPLSKIYIGYSVVDNDHFRKPQSSPNSQPYLLSVARYSPEKNLRFLIDAFKKSHYFQSHQLILIGDGPERSELENYIEKDSDRIKLTGWKSYEELPGWYQHADCFILPSTFEPWGLVVNEALASGTATLVSSVCGCIPDLINQNHSIFDPKNDTDLINHLNSVQITKKNKIDISIDCKTWAKTLESMIIRYDYIV